MDILKDLGDGLVLRRASKRDTEALVKMQLQAFANPDTGEEDEALGGWVRAMLGGKHPTFRPQDFLIVQDTKTDAIASCTCLISQTWSMGDISFGVGRVELVATMPAYQRRGLIREQFRVLHEWSCERGELLQSITGIPYYYRQFGYEYAIEMAAPRQTYVPQQVPELKKGEHEKFRLRHAKRADLQFVAKMYRTSAKHFLVSCERDLKMFEYEELRETNPINGHSRWWDVIETLKGERVGILLHSREVYKGHHNIQYFELLPAFDWQEVTPFVIRELVRRAPGYANDSIALNALRWYLASNHPMYEILADRFAPIMGDYAWYIRVPDLPAFLMKIAPIFKKRLAASQFRNYTGTLRLNFFRDGVALHFKNGTLKSAGPWRATASDYGQSGYGSASFPDRTFLKMLFGYRSRAELHAMFPDCLAENDQIAALLETLFPKQISHVLPIH